MSSICSLTSMEKCYEQIGQILKVSAVRSRLKELSRITGIQKAPVYPKGELFNTTTLPGKKQRLNFAVIKYTGILMPPEACWKQLKFLITYQILYLKSEILDL